MEYEDVVNGAGLTRYGLMRVSNDVFPGYVHFSEKYLRLPKSDPYDAILLLGAMLNHDFSEPNQDVVNSCVWNGTTKKSKSIKTMLISSLAVAVSQPSSLEDTYTEIQSAVALTDHGRNYMPGLHNEGVIGFGWRRLLLSSQRSYNWDGTNPCHDCEDIQNTLFDIWMSPKYYDYSEIGGLPTSSTLVFYHQSFEFGNEYGKQAYVMWKITAKVRFLASEKSLKHGE